MWKLNSVLLNNQWVTEEIKLEIKKKKKRNTRIQKSKEHNKSSSKREVYSNTALLQERKKISNNLTIHL